MSLDLNIGDQKVAVHADRRLGRGPMTVSQMARMARSFGADEVTVQEDAETASVDIQVTGMGVESRHAFMRYIQQHRPTGTAVSIEPEVPDEEVEEAIRMENVSDLFSAKNTAVANETVGHISKDSVAAAVSDYLDDEIDIWEFEERLDDMSLETIEEYCKYA